MKVIEFKNIKDKELKKKIISKAIKKEEKRRKSNQKEFFSGMRFSKDY